MASAEQPERPSDGFDPGQQQVGAIYARALMAAAEEAGQGEAVLAEIDEFVLGVVDKQPKLATVLASGLVSHEEKAALLDRALSGKASDLFLRFLKVVSKHGRLGSLRAIRRAAHAMYNEMKGRVPVEVRTAAPLDDQRTGHLQTRLGELLDAQPVIDKQVDPTLIGGLVVRVGDTVYDGSVATRLEQLRREMIHRSVHEIQSRRDRFRTAT